MGIPQWPFIPMKSHSNIYESHIKVKIEAYIEAIYLKGIYQIKRKTAITWKICVFRMSYFTVKALEVKERDIFKIDKLVIKNKQTNRKIGEYFWI